MPVSQRDNFLRYVAQTSQSPLMLEIVEASGTKLTDIDGKEYIDLISGISVSNVGHCHPQVVEAVKKQAGKYMHLMVYGEYVEHPQTLLAKKLATILPAKLSSYYFVNSGAEAVEGAMKLAKRYTGRHQIVSFKNSYHGSTQGALSIMGSEYYKNSFRPLLPGIEILDYNNTDQLTKITDETACVVIEPLQAEAGCVLPSNNFLQEVRSRCDQTNSLLVFDEIQTGFRRTGPMMAFESASVIPDVLLLAKAMGGGMPIGAFISSPDIMKSLTHDPVLGHITTFGGHPVSAAAALASLNVIVDIKSSDIEKKESLFREKLIHSSIKSVRGKGLLLAIEFNDAALNLSIIEKCIKKGVITDWFLFAPNCMRIAPPLTITNHEIFMSCDIILKSINESV